MFSQHIDQVPTPSSQCQSLVLEARRVSQLRRLYCVRHGHGGYHRSHCAVPATMMKSSSRRLLASRDRLGCALHKILHDAAGKRRRWDGSDQARTSSARRTSTSRWVVCIRICTSVCFGIKARSHQLVGSAFEDLSNNRRWCLRCGGLSAPVRSVPLANVKTGQGK